MRTRTKSQAHLGCLVLNVALGAEASHVQRRIEHYLEVNGPEWTCNRLKATRQVALLLKSGEREKAREVLQKNSIAYNHLTLVPRGAEGILVNHYLQARRPSAIKRADAALRYYTSLKLGELSEKQAQKAYQSISGYCTSFMLPSEMETLGWNFTKNSMKEREVRVWPLRSDPIRSDERHADHLKATSHYYSREELPKELKRQVVKIKAGDPHPIYPRSSPISNEDRRVIIPEVPYASMCLSFMTEPWVPAQLDRSTPCFEMREEVRSTEWAKRNPQLYAGKITALQEQGCKARVVCQPSAWLQLAFMPLHHRLVRITERMFPKEDCVKVQTKGAYSVLDHLARGNSVYCTDLSSATDRFPRWFSEGVLKAVGYEPYADALEEVCNMTFKCGFSPTGEIQYAVGQPMGLYGSFPLFHLSNLLVADGAVRRASRSRARSQVRPLIPFGDGSFFKVLGDDIVFSDIYVSLEYRDLMSNLGVQISESKSFAGKVAEFAGFIALQDSGYQTVYRPYKVPVGDYVSNPIQFLDSIGAGLRNAPHRVRPYWEKQWRAYVQTVGSRDIALEPLVPGDSLPSSDTYRGDNRTMVALSQRLCDLLDWRRSGLPDLSGSTRINRDPLFLEQRPGDYYGYNPALLRKDEEEAKVEPLRRTTQHLSTDPLMREIRGKATGRLIRKDPSPKSGLSPSERILLEAQWLDSCEDEEDEFP